MRTASPPTLARFLVILIAFGTIMWMFLSAVDAHAAPAPAGAVPPLLVELINATYGPDPDGAHGSPETVEKQLARYGEVAAAFEQRWAAFSARKAEVDKAIAAGDALAKAGKYDDAIAAVTAVITPIARDDRGQLPKQRELLEVRDAELGAVFAWSRYAEAKQDYAPVADIAAAMFVRRKTAEKADEELLWFGEVEAKSLGFLAGSPDETKRVQQAIEDAYRTKAAGHDLAWGYYKSLESHFGLVKTAVEDTQHAKKGGGVLMDLVPSKIDDKKLAFTEDEEWQEPYDCTLTDKIDAIDPDTGKVSYKETCKYRTVKRHSELKGTFASAPPSWARATGDDAAAITIAGHVDAAGPKWVLSNVRVLDFRFIKGGDDNATENILDLMGQGD